MTDGGKRASPGWQAAEVPGQAAARGQFALFDKGRTLARWYQRHGAGSKGQGADRATAPRYRFSVIGCTGDTPASTGIQLSSIGRIPTRRGIEWLEILRLRSRLRASYGAASRMTRKENRAAKKLRLTRRGMSGRREAPRCCYLLLVLSLLEDAGDMPASTDFRSNLELRRLAQAPLQTYGATRRIILLLEWSKNLPIDQHRSGKRRGW